MKVSEMRALEEISWEDYLTIVPREQEAKVGDMFIDLDGRPMSVVIIGKEKRKLEINI